MKLESAFLPAAARLLAQVRLPCYAGGMSVKDFGQDQRDEQAALHDVKAAAKAHNKLALDTLAEICADRDASASARGFAAVALLDRANGKPKDDDAGGRSLGRMSLDDLLALRDAILLRAAAPAPTTAPEPDLGRKLPPIAGLVIDGVSCPVKEPLQDD